MTKFVTNPSGAIWWPNLEVMQAIQVPLKSILKYLTLIFLATEFASFVAGKIIQLIEAMPGSIVPLAMFSPQTWFVIFVTNMKVCLRLISANACKISYKM